MSKSSDMFMEQRERDAQKRSKEIRDYVKRRDTKVIKTEKKVNR